MAPNPSEPTPDPAPYPRDQLALRTDNSGNDIVVRPRQFLASGDPGDVEEAVVAIAEDVLGGAGKERVISYEEDERGQPARVRGTWVRYRLEVNIDELRVVRGLRERGIPAQPNHVYFVNSRTNRMQGQFDPNLFAPNLFAPNLFAPNLFAPNLFAPNLFAPNLFAPNLFAPNLFAPNLFAPNLFAGGGEACCCPGGLSDGETLGTPTLAARPVDDPCDPCSGDARSAKDGTRVEIHVIDVVTPAPTKPTTDMTGEYLDPAKPYVEGTDNNTDGWADPAIAHGDFVKSVVELNSGLTARMWSSSDPLGDIDDVHVVAALQDVRAASDSKKIRIVNLSLSGYNEDDRPSNVLADEIAGMIKDGWLVVASAGNNASCRLAWPAALPGVIAVGAVGPHGPAWFSNHGSWVDACAHGVDVVAEFPDLSGLTKRLVARTADDAEITTHAFSTGWARWSGTSFSAPLVAARLARRIEDGLGPDDAVALVIDDPTLPRLPQYGTLVR